MSEFENFQLTTKDYTILEVLRNRYAAENPILASVLARKLSRAVVMFRDDIPPTVVTMSSRVRFQVDGGPPQIRIVAHDEMRGLVGLLIPAANPRGAALIGLAEGQSMSIPRPQGGVETVTALQIIYQPESAMRGRAARALGAGAVLPLPERPALKLVRGERRIAAAPAMAANSGDGFDDPGPSAA